LKTKAGSKSTPILGYLLILLNISQFLTIIPSLLFGNREWYFHQSFIIVLNVLFLINSKLRPDLFSDVKKSIVHWALVILCLIFLLEFPRYLINSDGRNLILTILNGIEFITFYYVLSSVFYSVASKRGYQAANQGLLKTYVIFTSFIVLSSVAVFILTSLRLINPTSYPMPTDLSMNVNSNANNLGTQYYFPLHLTVVTSDNRGLPFFSNYGVFCGLSHEPHIATYLITPSLFFMQLLDWGKRKKIILTIFYVFFILLATSTTNLIGFMVVLIILIIINIKNGQNKFLNVAFLVTIIAVFSFFSVSDLGFAAIKAKLDTSSGTSLDYSKNFLTHVVTPKGFWGDGAFNVPFPNVRVDDIGILFSVLLIFFYLLLLIAAIKLIISSTRALKFIGAGCLYFLLHTLKVVQLTLIYPFTIMIIFYMIIAFQADKRKIYSPSKSRLN